MVKSFTCAKCGSLTLERIAWLYNRKRIIFRCAECTSHTSYAITSKGDLNVVLLIFLLMFVMPIIAGTIHFKLCIVYGVILLCTLLTLTVKYHLNQNILPYSFYDIQILTTLPKDPYLVYSDYTVWQKMLVYKPLIIWIIILNLLVVVLTIRGCLPERHRHESSSSDHQLKEGLI